VKKGVAERIMDHTMRFEARRENEEARRAFQLAYKALSEKGYNPVYQIAGYLISGDPAYITSHLDARNTIRRIERDELIEELVRAYAESNGYESPRS
jgi:uncharacterized protein (UPF0297 family)